MNSRTVITIGWSKKLFPRSWLFRSDFHPLPVCITADESKLSISVQPSARICEAAQSRLVEIRHVGMREDW